MLYKIPTFPSWSGLWSAKMRLISRKRISLKTHQTLGDVPGHEWRPLFVYIYDVAALGNAVYPVGIVLAQTTSLPRLHR